MIDTVLGLLRQIRLADVVDIVLVTTLVSTAVVWIRRTQAALVAIGILLLGLLYLAARALGLQLTAWIFQGFFAIFLIIIVVIFQEELRQLFEYVALWGLRRGGRRPVHTDVADVLVPCLNDLARDRVGALVVLPGTQPVARHVRGGIPLDGALSMPLLKSIFDPHSPGHDGAVIVENGRVTRFATHLPLSTDFAQLAGVGTRHSAALGLAELTDALCLVVSEERGLISVAERGRLRQLADAQELASIVRRFFTARRPVEAPRRLWEQLFRQHWVENLASLIVVVGLWYLFVPGSRPAQEAIEVPVRVINVPEGYVIEKVQPDKVTATFSGPARAFYLLDRREFEVTIDGSLAKLGRRTFEISVQAVRHPRDLTVVEVQPREVTIAAREPPGERSAQTGAAR